MESRKIEAEMITEIIKFKAFILERRNLLFNGINKCAEGHTARSLSAKSLSFLQYYVFTANKVLGTRHEQMHVDTALTLSREKLEEPGKA